jgi:maleate isomerase
MPDVLGYRALFGVIGPSTNTVVQPDFEAMRPAGVTNHYSRIFVTDPEALSDDDFIAGTRAISDNTLDAVRSVVTCRPDYLVMGMSAITFYGGVAGGEAFRRKVVETAGVEISIGSIALVEALRAYGTVGRVAFVSPYYPVANAEVRRYLEESGFSVVRDVALRCRSWTDIAKVRPARLRTVLAELDGDDVDALVQVGTNLSMVRLAAETEARLGKPVVAINTATYWHALRACGIADRTEGFGRLLAEF